MQNRQGMRIELLAVMAGRHQLVLEKSETSSQSTNWGDALDLAMNTCVHART